MLLVFKMIRHVYFDIMKRYDSKLITEKQKDLELKIMELEEKKNYWQTKVNEAQYYIKKNQEKINSLKLKLDIE